LSRLITIPGLVFSGVDVGGEFGGEGGEERRTEGGLKGIEVGVVHGVAHYLLVVLEINKVSNGRESQELLGAILL
jgi:hypothetical protein